MVPSASSVGSTCESRAWANARSPADSGSMLHCTDLENKLGFVYITPTSYLPINLTYIFVCLIEYIFSIKRTRVCLTIVRL